MKNNYKLLAAISLFFIAQAMHPQNRTLKTLNTSDPQQIQNSITQPIIFIDAFVVPENARKAFLERMEINRDFIRTLPGFVEDHAYEKTIGDGKFNYITVVKWESEDAVNNAKKEVTSLYVSQNFNIQEFFSKLNITLERATYTEMR